MVQLQPTTMFSLSLRCFHAVVVHSGTFQPTRESVLTPSCSSYACLLILMSFFAWYNKPIENIFLCMYLSSAGATNHNTYCHCVSASLAVFSSYLCASLSCVCVCVGVWCARMCLWCTIVIRLTSVCVGICLSLFAHPVALFALTRLVHAVQTTTWYVWANRHLQSDAEAALGKIFNVNYD